MKTTKVTTILASAILVIFMSAGSIAGTSPNYGGDVTLAAASKKNDLIKSSSSVSAVLIKTVNEFRNKLTRVSNIADGNEANEIKQNSYDYLKFNANDFVNESTAENSEMPVENEFDYLRFDVNNYTESSTTELTEMPVENFDYLRFDLNNYAAETQAQLSEMPADDFNYLHFDVSKFSDNPANSTDTLPSAE